MIVVRNSYQANSKWPRRAELQETAEMLPDPTPMLGNGYPVGP
jgi:hypothetical protein